MSFLRSTFDFVAGFICDAQIMMHPNIAIKKSYQGSTLVLEP